MDRIKGAVGAAVQKVRKVVGRKSNPSSPTTSRANPTEFPAALFSDDQYTTMAPAAAAETAQPYEDMADVPRAESYMETPISQVAQGQKKPAQTPKRTRGKVLPRSASVGSLRNVEEPRTLQRGRLPLPGEVDKFAQATPNYEEIPRSAMYNKQLPQTYDVLTRPSGGQLYAPAMTGAEYARIQREDAQHGSLSSETGHYSHLKPRSVSDSTLTDTPPPPRPPKPKTRSQSEVTYSTVDHAKWREQLDQQAGYQHTKMQTEPETDYSDIRPSRPETLIPTRKRGVSALVVPSTAPYESISAPPSRPVTPTSRPPSTPTSQSTPRAVTPRPRQGQFTAEQQSQLDELGSQLKEAQKIREDRKAAEREALEALRRAYTLGATGEQSSSSPSATTSPTEEFKGRVFRKYPTPKPSEFPSLRDLPTNQPSTIRDLPDDKSTISEEETHMSLDDLEKRGFFKDRF